MNSKTTWKSIGVSICSETPTTSKSYDDDDDDGDNDEDEDDEEDDDDGVGDNNDDVVGDQGFCLFSTRGSVRCSDQAQQECSKVTFSWS